MAHSQKISETKPILLQSDSDDPEVEVAPQQPWFKRRAVTTSAVLGLALLGAVLYATSGAQPSSFLTKAAVEDSVQLRAMDASTWYVIKHHFKNKDDSKKWWQGAHKLMADKKAFKRLIEDTAAAGFSNHYFFPTAEEGPFICVWEAKAGKSLKDMEDFINDNALSPATEMHNEVLQIDTKLVGGPPGKSVFQPESRRLDSAAQSSFYIIEHTMEDKDKADPWWKMVHKVMASKDKYAELVSHFEKRGFYNQLMMPTAKTGPVFCVWEAKEGKTQHDMEDFINTDEQSPANTKTTGWSNDVMPIISPGGPPMNMKPHFT